MCTKERKLNIIKGESKMKKKVAKILKKYGDGNLFSIEIIKEYKAKTLPKGETTVAIKGTRRAINHAIGQCMLNGKNEERLQLGKMLIGNYYEDWDADKNLVIKY